MLVGRLVRETNQDDTLVRIKSYYHNNVVTGIEKVRHLFIIIS